MGKGKVIWVKDEVYEKAKELVDKGIADSLSEVVTIALEKQYSESLDKLEVKKKLREIAKLLEEISEKL